MIKLPGAPGRVLRDFVWKAVVVRHPNGRLYRTPFLPARPTDLLPQWTECARERGYTVIARITAKSVEKPIPGERGNKLVEIEQ